MQSIRRHLVAAVTLSLVGLLSACPGGGDDAPPPPDGRTNRADASPTDPDAAPPDAQEPDAAPDAIPDAIPDAPDGSPGCSPWIVDVNSAAGAGATFGARVEGGVLVLSAQGDTSGNCSSNEEPCDSIKIFQRSLRGDFDVTVEVDGLDSAAAFEGVSLFLSTRGAFNRFSAASILGGVGHPILSVENRGFGSSQQSTIAPSTRATLRVRRVDGKVTLSGVSGDESIEMPNLILGDELQVGVSLDQGSSPAISARIASFTVTGGGGTVCSDGFDSDATLYP